VFFRPSVKDYRKSFGGDFGVSSGVPQTGSQFDHFAVSEQTGELRNLLDRIIRREINLHRRLVSSRSDQGFEGQVISSEFAASAKLSGPDGAA